MFLEEYIWWFLVVVLLVVVHFECLKGLFLIVSIFVVEFYYPVIVLLYRWWLAPR